MRSFEDLANGAFAILAINSDLIDYPRWRAHNPDLELYFPEGVPTLEQILEGDARLAEHQALVHMGATTEAWEEWRIRSVTGTYAPAYEWLVRELGNVDVARIAVEIVLTGPIDLIRGGALTQGDAFPGDGLCRRLPALMAPSKNRCCAQELSVARRPRVGGARAPRDSTESRVPNARANVARDAGPKLCGYERMGCRCAPSFRTAGTIGFIPVQPARADVRPEIRRKDFLAFSQPRDAEIFQPLLEFFTDIALFNGAPRGVAFARSL